jgi:predicted AlkP superfamily pyrophosphatase or phosphodiesterase
MQAAGPNTVFALVSDHGMAGISKYFNPNRALADAGLLTFAAVASNFTGSWSTASGTLFY